MSSIKIDLKTMQLISLFESLTHSKVKDCIDGNTVIFIVDQGEIAKAIGKNASNVKRIEGMLKKNVKIIEYNEDLIQFVRNSIAPLRVNEVSENEKIITLSGADTKTKGMIIGREASNLKKLKELVSRHFDIADIVVK